MRIVPVELGATLERGTNLAEVIKVGLSESLTAIGRRLTGILTPGRSHRAIWEEGIDSETEFWEAWARGKGLEWPHEFKERIDPETPLQAEIRELLDPTQDPLRLLDIGSGPMTCLGKQWDGRRIEITAVDPLADRYQEILEKYQIRPVITTRRGEAERLSEYFARDSFDLVFARNCLDHSYDPEAAISEMLAVVKPGSFIHLEHRINEGENVGYVGLHQWNFYAAEGDFFIAGRRSRRNMTRALAGLASVHCVERDGWIIVRLKKLT